MGIYMPSMGLHYLTSHILTECDDPGVLPIPSASYMMTAIERSSDFSPFSNRYHQTLSSYTFKRMELVGCWADASGDLMHLARLANLGLAH